MLQNIRDNSQGIIAKIIIGLIILTFALFGIDSLVGGSGPAKAAEVNGEEITVMQLEQAINNQKRQLINRFGEQLDPTMLDDERLKPGSLETLITRTLLLQAADQAEMGMAPEAIDQAIVAMPEFQQDGQFSPERYQSLLRSNGYSTAYFKQILQEDIVVNQLQAALAGSDFVTTKSLETVAVSIGEQRSFRYLLIPQSKMLDQVEITEQQQRDFYQQNLAQFQTEDRLSLDYIEIKLQDFFKPVDPEQLQALYQETVQSSFTPAERRASHILIEVNDDRDEQQALQKATELAAEIAAGGDFIAIAAEQSDDPASAENGGDLGFSSGDIFPEAFEEALAALQVDEVSAPVKTDAGYHLIKLTEFSEKQAPSFEELAPTLTSQIQAGESEAEFIAAVEELRDLVFNSEGLVSVATELNVNLQQSPLISRSTAEGVLADARVLNAAFDEEVLKQGNNSEVIELSTDHYVVVAVREHQPPADKPFDEVKALITQRLTSEGATALSQQVADEIAQRLAAGETMETIANEGGYEWQVFQNVTRNSAEANREILRASFDLSLPGDDAPVREAATLGSGDVAVIELEKVIPGSWQQFSEVEKQAIRAELNRNGAMQTTSALLRSLRQSADITIF